MVEQVRDNDAAKAVRDQMHATGVETAQVVGQQRGVPRRRPAQAGIAETMRFETLAAQSARHEAHHPTTHIDAMHQHHRWVRILFLNIHIVLPPQAK